MAEKYNPTTGQIEAVDTVSTDDVAQTYGIPKDVVKSGKIPMLTNGGKPVWVSSEELDQAISKGYTYESPDEAKERQLQKEYGDRPAAALGLGIAKAATLGLSDAAGAALGYGDAIREISKRNESAKVLGDVAATAGLTLGTLGTGLLAKGAGATAPGIIAKLSAGAGEKLVAKKIVEETGKETLKRQLARSAVQAGTEGAMYGVGQTISEVSLSEQDLTPQQIAEVAAINIGGGALLGAGMGVAGTAVSHGIGAGSKKFSNFIRGVRGEAEDSAEKTTAALLAQNTEKANIKSLEESARALGVELTPGQRSASKVIQNIESSLMDSPTAVATAYMEGPNKIRAKLQADTEALLQDAGRQTKLEAGESIRDMLVKDVQKSYEPFEKAYAEIRRHTANIPVTKKSKDLVTRNILNIENARLMPTSPSAQITKRYAEAVAGAQSVDDLVKISSIAKKEMRGNLSLDNAQKETFSQVVGKIENMIDNNTEREAIRIARTGPEGRELAKELSIQRKNVNLAYKKTKELFGDLLDGAGLKRLKNAGPKELQRVLEEEIVPEKLVDKLFDKNNVRAMQKMAEDFPHIFERVRRFEIGSVFKQATDGGLVDLDMNKVLRLTDSSKPSSRYSPEMRKLIFGPSGDSYLENLGRYQKSAPKMLNPAGTAKQIQLNETFGDIFKRMTQEVADTTKIAILRGAPKIDSALKKQNSILANGLNAFFKGTTKAAPSARAGAIVAVLGRNKIEFEKRQEELAVLQQDPEKLLNRIANNIQGIAEEDPAVGMELSNIAMRSFEFLQSKMPKTPQAPVGFSKKSVPPSDAELMKWNRYILAVENPLSIVDDLQGRVLTKEAVEAVQNIYPGLYQKITEQVMKLAGEKKDMSYQDRLQMNILLGSATDGTLSPGFISRMQGGAKKQAEQQSGGQAAGQKQMRKTEMTGAQNTMTATERVINR